ncbi:hypothetical protein ALI22I_00270 [Saccharothrix sp. ALI-22-I]|nr:hypothetical protein ALI22I_00270 [Saccharothrix sp. ALI-22-I]
MSLRTYLFVAGGLMAVSGFLGLGVSVTIPTNSFAGESTCGNGFAQLPDASVVQLTEGLEKCEAATSARRMWAWPLLGVGVLVAMAGFIDRDKGKAGGGTTRTA